MNIDNNSHGKIVAKGEVVFVRQLPGPIERVWRYLTDAELRATWFAGGEMEPRKGGTADLHFFHANLSGPGDVVPEEYAEFAVTGEVMRVTITGWQPPHFLSYTWNDGEEPGGLSEVSFELEPVGDSIRLTLHHRKLANVHSVASGWHTHLTILLAKLEGGEAPLIWNTHTKYVAEYAELLK
jgi:uncharacterized protein YndB with AHSA1/START domain